VHDIFVKLEELVRAMDEEVEAFQEAGMHCEGLSKMTSVLDARLGEIEIKLSMFDDPRYSGWKETMRLLYNDLAGIKEKSLRKLGEACCKSKGGHECRAKVVHVIESLKVVKKAIEDAHAKVNQDLGTLPQMAPAKPQEGILETHRRNVQGTNVKIIQGLIDAEYAGANVIANGLLAPMIYTG